MSVEVNLNVYREVSYRYDIQGIRAVGAILIMIYHIWFSKVSGGVDVFFVVSGYFMAGMLARPYLRSGKINPFDFWGKIIKRVAPLAYTIIAITLISGYFFMSPTLWQSNIKQAITSALHIENWYLIRLGTDYLASDNSAGPLQQFWALSLQIQFYFILPIVMTVGFSLSNYYRTYKPVIYLVTLIIITSFLFSVYYTKVNPSSAYFNTLTRAWEFFVGVAIYLVLPFVSITPRVARALLLAAFLLVMSIGFITTENAAYPGYIALIPVFSAAIIILAGAFCEGGYTYKFLSSKPLVYIGGISFSLYLWHWPILVYFKSYFGIEQGEVTLVQGVFIILFSFLLSVVTNKFIERPFSKIKSTKIFVPYVVGAAFFIPLVFISYIVLLEINEVADKYAYNGAENEYSNLYEGDSVYVQQGPSGIRLKRFVSIKGDRSPSSSIECSEGLTNDGVSHCEFGDKSSEDSILLVGGSRLAHWDPVFSYLGRKHGFKVITATIHSCSFGSHPIMEGGVNVSLTKKEKCENWNNEVMSFISDIKPKPKLVVMNSSRVDVGTTEEYTPSGYIDNVKEVLSLGIPVVGIRIAPVFNKPNECLWRNSNDASKCSVSYSSTLKEKNPAIIAKNDENLIGFYPVDFTRVICDENGQCPSAFEGEPALYDSYHFTNTYISYLAESLSTSLDDQVGGLEILLKN